MSIVDPGVLRMLDMLNFASNLEETYFRRSTFRCGERMAREDVDVCGKILSLPISGHRFCEGKRGRTEETPTCMPRYPGTPLVFYRFSQGFEEASSAR